MQDDPIPEFRDTGLVSKEKWQEAFAIAWNEITKAELLNDHYMRVFNKTYDVIVSAFPEAQKPQAKKDFFSGLPVLQSIIFHKTIDGAASPS